MKNRVALLILVTLVTLALAASVSEDAESATDTPSTSSSGQQTKGERPKPSQAAKQKSSSTTYADEPEPEVVSTPSFSSSTVTLPAPEPGTSEEAFLAQHDPGGRGSGHRNRGNRGRRGGWRPPSRPPHGRRGLWRRNRYSVFGSWHFLIFGGPLVYYPVPRSPSVIRVPRRSGVYVRQTGDDLIGRAFATAVRERLREQGIKVVYSSDKAALELYIVSMEQDPEDPGWGSSVSVSYLSYPGQHFITSQMLDVGDEQVGELADLVVEYAVDLSDDY